MQKGMGLLSHAGTKGTFTAPTFEGVDTPEQQIEIALSKASIDINEDYSIERFEVIRHR